MKPLGKSAVRTQFAENIAALLEPVFNGTPESGERELTATQIAAIIGGAIDETLREVNGSLDTTYRMYFWRYFNHNLWNLTRTLRASNLLGKV